MSARPLRLGQGSRIDSLPFEKALSAGVEFGTDGTKLSMSGGAVTHEPAASSTASDFEIGWRRTPILTQNAAYTFAQQDRGKAVQKTDAVARSYTVNAGVFGVGDELTVINNNAASNITIVQGAGVTLRLANTVTTGNRTVARWGRARMICIAANVLLVDGPGVT